MCDIRLVPKNKNSVKIFFAGDVVLRDSTCKGGRFVDSEVRLLIEKCDVACCNLEGPIEKEGIMPVPKRGSFHKNGICSPMRLKESGFNMLTLANNHIMDYGMDGLIYSLNILEKDFCCIGAGRDIEEVYRLQKIHLGNLVIGFIAVAESQFGVCKEEGGGFAWMLSRKLLKLFHQANKECDHYFVICHCGAEELEVPLPEVRELYRAYIDLGADAVIGHHPHVIQGSEDYKGKKIFYSLGNFAFDLEDQDLPYNPIGLCILAEIANDGIQYHPVITEYKEKKITICGNFDTFEKANRMLASDDGYSRRVEDYCIEAYESYFRKYYALVLGLDIESKENLFKFAQHRVNGDEILWDELFLYHNIVIETNRWICERAIKTMQVQEEKNDKKT